jgi:hypothetical protein
MNLAMGLETNSARKILVSLSLFYKKIKLCTEVEFLIVLA